MNNQYCPHGLIIGAQGGIAQNDINACEGNENDEMAILAFYSTCDCCDTLMHHSTCWFGYFVMDDGRTLCERCSFTEKLILI